MINTDKIIIIGAGASGVGVGIALKELGIDNFVILDKGKVGNSFLNWPRETKFISPSFTSNMFNMPDLNAISPLTSPAFTFNKQHLSGKEYSDYLVRLQKHWDLPIIENVEVLKITKEKETFTLSSKEEKYKCKYLIWAGGQYSYPNNIFENSIHTSAIKSYKELADTNQEEYLVIGNGESAFDFAINLAKLSKKVKIISQYDFKKDLESDDPSKKLSPITLEKYENIKNEDLITFFTGSKVDKIEFKGDKYEIFFSDGKKMITKDEPYSATGFNLLPNLIENFVDIIGVDLSINNYDESRKTKNLFIVGPSVNREKIILCFIYKFRMRFAVVACEIAKRIKLEKGKIAKIKNHYKKYNMYLEDLKSCDLGCDC